MRSLLPFFIVFFSISSLPSQKIEVSIKSFEKHFYYGMNNYFTVQTCNGDTISRQNIRAYRNHFSWDDSEKGYSIIKTPIEIIDNDKISFYIHNNEPGSIDFEIYYNDSIYKQNFKSHPIPVVGKLSKHSARFDRKISIGEMKSVPGIIAQITGINLCGICKIIEFEIWKISKNGKSEMTVNIGGRFSENAQRIIQETKGGDLYLFRKIFYKCSGDSDPQQMEDMTFEIREYDFILDTINYPNGYQILQKVEKQTGDTITHDQFTGEFKKTSKEGILLVEGSYRNLCGEPSKHSHWIERYRDGLYKTIGSYYCGQKYGTWTYYSDSGKISKIESYDHAYNLMNGSDHHSAGSPILQTGEYIEYHSNGKKKVEGQYTILEMYFPTDTIHKINYETYEEYTEIVKGDFWRPVSIKSGRWITYNVSGKMINIDLKSLPSENIYRRIEE